MVCSIADIQCEANDKAATNTHTKKRNKYLHTWYLNLSFSFPNIYIYICIENLP